MEKPVGDIYQTLQKLVGLHRHLLEMMRSEREALAQADLPGIHRVTLSKQAMIEEIYQTEALRVKQTGELALLWKKPLRQLTLTQIIILSQGSDPKGADQLRSVFNTLNILVQRLIEQNKYNSALIQKSIAHIYQMKRNILEEALPQSSVYTHQGQRMTQVQSSRLISKEV